MTTVSFAGMWQDIAGEIAITACPLPKQFCPADLQKNVALFDSTLDQYLQIYRCAGITPRRYADANAFAADYSKT